MVDESLLMRRDNSVILGYILVVLPRNSMLPADAYVAATENFMIPGDILMIRVQIPVIPDSFCALKHKSTVLHFHLSLFGPRT